MFGYIRPRKAEMKIKEYEYYKAVYCGLCHAEKKLSRRLRYTLSYDMVLLALCRIGALGEQSSFSKKRCPAHPAKGGLAVVDSPSLAYTAQVASILVYHKLLDDIADEKGFRKLAAKMMLGGAKRAKNASPNEALDTFVKEKLNELYTLEKEGGSSVYDGAERFGELLGRLFSEGDTLSQADKVCLHEIGTRVGRFIYITDAYADREEDKKKGRYNPFHADGEESASESFRRSLVNALDIELLYAANALDLLSLKDSGIDCIIRNILTMGLPDVAEKVILKQEKIESSKELHHEKRPL